MAIEDFYITCTKKTPVYSNGDRKYISSYTDTTINGKIGRMSKKEVNIGSRQVSLTIINFFCDDLSLKESDRILYGSKLYEVVGEPQNTMNDHHIKAELKIISNLKQ